MLFQKYLKMKQEHRRNQERLLPSTNNRAGKSASRVNAQSLHYSVFMMIPCHNIPEDLHSLTEILKDTLPTLSNKRMPAITPKDKLNSEVASWITSHTPQHQFLPHFWRTMFVKVDFPPSQPTIKILKIPILLPQLQDYCPTANH
jgi:hypothetical protein